MKHILFDGDEIMVTATVDAGEFLPHSQQPDGVGFYMTLYSGDWVTVTGPGDDGMVKCLYQDEELGIVDVEVELHPNEFDHDCQCEFVGEEHFDDPEVVTWETHEPSSLVTRLQGLRGWFASTVRRLRGA